MKEGRVEERGKRSPNQEISDTSRSIAISTPFTSSIPQSIACTMRHMLAVFGPGEAIQRADPPAPSPPRRR
jgi:hypothetical protein